MTSARYSPIAPVALLNDLAEHEVRGEEITLGGYLLMLAHDVLEEPTAYRTLAGDVRHRYGENTFIIMDNSVVELGRPMPMCDVIMAAGKVQANCIVTPDVLGSLNRTQDAVRNVRDEMLASDHEIMMIPQGASWQQLLACVDWLRSIFDSHLWEREYWGIPRWIANKMSTRSQLISYILSTGTEDTRVHLLGMSNHMRDDLLCSRMPRVIGIDSANPLVNGHYGHDLAYDTYRHLNRGDFWDRKMANEKIITNVRNMHAWVGQRT